MTPARFLCPICGHATRVAETRPNPSGLRRRRWCVERSCGGRLTTQEIIITSGSAHGTRRVMDGEHVLLPRKVWEDITRLAAYALEGAQPAFDEGGEGDGG